MNIINKFIVFLSVALTAYITISSYTRGVKRDLDFKVYYKAGERVMQGDLDLYNFKKDGIFSFKYSPFSALVFTPLALTDLKTSQKIWCFFNALAFLLTFYLSWKILIHLNGRPERIALLLLLTLISLARPILNNAMQANVNMFLALIINSSIYYSLKGKKVLAGLILSLGVSIKIVPITLCGFFLFNKRFKEIFSTLGFTLLFFIIPFFYFGYDENITLLNEWFHCLKDKNHFPFYKWTNQSAYNVWFHITGNEPLAKIIFNSHYLITLVLLYFFVRTRDQNKLISFCIMTILLVSPVVWIEYFIILFYPIMYLHMSFLENTNSKNWKFIYVLRYIFLNFLGKFLIGKYAAEQITYYGQMYWGLILLVGLIYYSSKKKTIPTQ